MKLRKLEMLPIFVKALKEAQSKLKYFESKSEFYLTRFQATQDEVKNLERLIAELEKEEG